MVLQLPKVGIVVLNWNGKKDTLICLQSLEHLNYPTYEIVVVDNGSTDDSVVSIRNAYPKIILLETGKNLGYAGGNNVGIHYGLEKNWDLFLILNNDTIVDENLLNAFNQGFAAHPEAGVLGGKIYLMNEPKKFDHFGGNWNKARIDFDYVGHRQIDDGSSWETMIPIDYVCGAAIMIQRRVFDSIGILEERFFLFWEETDFCFRARRAGFEIFTCPKAKIWHKVSASFVGGKPQSTYFFWRNRLFWIDRNFSGFEHFFYFFRLLIFTRFSIYKSKFLRQLQFVLGRIFLPGKNQERNINLIKRYQAALCGMKDYKKRNFGSGSSSLFLK